MTAPTSARDLAAAASLLGRLAPGDRPGRGEARRMLRLMRRAGGALGLVDEHAGASFPVASMPYQLAVLAGAFDAEARLLFAPPRPAAPSVFAARAGHTPVDLLRRGARVPVLDVNAADAATLASRPGLGAVSARRIVARREALGPYTELDEVRVAGRVRGSQWETAAPFLRIGDGAGPEVSTRVQDEVRAGGAAAAVRLLVAGEVHLDGIDTSSLHAAALSFVEAATRRIELKRAYPPHWGPDADRLRRGARALQADVARRRGRARPDGVAVVRGSDYLALAGALIDAATEHVRVSMFFFNTDDEDGPAATLVGALERAAGRGVAVQVLLDDDLPDDYHGARLVNEATRARLASRGISSRATPLDRTYHAKVLLVDDRHVLAGSHNWTASSFYLYDDTSLYVESTAAAAAAAGRFDRYWDAADPDAASRRVSVLDLEWFTPWERAVLVAEGVPSAAELAEAGRLVSGRRRLASALRCDEEHVRIGVRIAGLLGVFPVSETTAAALVGAGLDAPSEVRRASIATLQAALGDLSRLPDPFRLRRLPPGVPAWVAGMA
ncbi:MAG: DUF4332 domain-containing protein [Dehalococcoidia bacterium]